MKPIKLVLLGLCLSAATSLFASNHNMKNHENMNHANMNHGVNSVSNHAAYHNEMMTRDDYKVSLRTNKPFVNGNNEVEIMISHKEEVINNADVKIKFFMPEMPGMPYMEYEAKAKFKDGKYKCDVNLAMNGTWQYQLKFRTNDKKIRTVKGSISY